MLRKLPLMGAIVGLLLSSHPAMALIPPKTPSPASATKSAAPPSRPNKVPASSGKGQPAITGPLPAPAATPTSVADVASDEDRVFKRLSDQATRLYDQQQYAAAIPILEQAHRLRPQETVILGLLGHCHEEVGSLSSALNYLLLFRKIGRDSDGQDLTAYDRGMLEQHIARLEKKVEQEERRRFEELLPPKRPRWRLGLGAGLLSVSGILIGFGVPPMVIHDQCIRSPMPDGAACSLRYDTQSLGTGLLASGSVIALVGTVVLAWPPRVKNRK